MDDDEEPTDPCAPDVIEPEQTRMFARHDFTGDPTTIFDLEDRRVLLREEPTVRAKGSAQMAVAEVPGDLVPLVPVGQRVPRPVERVRAASPSLAEVAEPRVFVERHAMARIPIERRAAVVREAGAVSRAAARVPPIPPRRRAVTPVSLDDSYEAAMRQFR